MKSKRLLTMLLVSLLTIISINSTVMACNKHMNMVQFFEADRKAGVTNPLISRMRGKSMLENIVMSINIILNEGDW